MKSVLTLSFCTIVLFMSSCFKPKEPRAKICPEEPLIITTVDTLELENCSDNDETHKWELPGGVVSSQNKVALASALPATYNIKLSVSNNDYANDYITTRVLKIVSKNFTTSTINFNPTSNTDTITICTIVNDLDANDPDGYYGTSGAPAGYQLVEDKGDGCYVYAPDAMTPPNGQAVTYHYFCIDNTYCDTTKVVITN